MGFLETTMGLCGSSSGLVGVGGGLFFGSPRGREMGGAGSVTTSTNLIPGQPTASQGRYRHTSFELFKKQSIERVGLVSPRVRLLSNPDACRSLLSCVCVHTHTFSLSLTHTPTHTHTHTHTYTHTYTHTGVTGQAARRATKTAAETAAE